MKRIIAILTLVSLAIAAAAQTTVPATDACITYTGRVVAAGDCVSFDWSGTTFRVAFQGTSLTMNCSDVRHDWFNVWIDKEPVPMYDKVFDVQGDTTVVIVPKIKKGNHEVVVQKRTEGEQGCLTIRSFTTDGRFISAAAPRERHIEFVGDSYTCGYGTEGADRDQPFRAEEENCNLAYDHIIARFFECDVNLVSHSGMGIVRNYADNLPGDSMVKRYSQAFDMDPDTPWTSDMAAYRPDIVVIYLGTNDFSEGKQPKIGVWCENYSALIAKIRANYGPVVPILCVASNADEVLEDYVRTAVSRCGQPNVCWTSVQSGAHNLDSDLGSSWHPNYQGQRKVAACMIPYISTLTGWEMPLKPIE